MKALILGSKGQLGRALQNSRLPGFEFAAVDRLECDISDEGAIHRTIQSSNADIVINAAAYTAVDRAENDRDLAHAINGVAPGWMAEACVAAGKKFMHVSTDFVFGMGHSRPIHTDATPNPINIYGKSKLQGEINVQTIMPNALIVRTSWVYGAQGNNFVKTMLRFMLEKDELGVVSDQIGTPTAVEGLAAALLSLAQSGSRGIMHFTDSGVASWYDFAVAINEDACAIGLLPQLIRISPIPSTAYPTAAERPSYSVLDTSATWQILGAHAPHWRVALRKILSEIKSHG